MQRIKRNHKKLSVIFCGVFVIVFLASLLMQNLGKIGGDALAANLAGFQPGYIISDFQMTDSGSMSEGDIQAFLSSKNSCNETDYGYYLALSRNTGYTWHFENGHFVCLSEERFGNNDNEIGFQYGESAAHIIWQAAQDYRINPKVLLVLLQKETGLITDPIPNNGDYRKATGYGCPDTAACSSKYYGFKNQIRNAAELFRIVMDGNSSYYPIGNNYIQYNPNAGCGGSIVNVQNLATSALYRYTPYQPNAEALAAGYGTAPCGAYGNRNFYSYFEDWFGGILDTGWPSMYTLLTTNRITTESSDLPIKYKTHINHYGWMDPVDGGVMAGTAGYGLRVEAVALQLGDGIDGAIEYRTHVQNRGWLDYVKNGQISGTTGESLQVEAIQIKLTGEVAKRYDVYYRAHLADRGWTDWVKNDEISGTVGESRQMEALQVEIREKESVKGLSYRVHTENIGWANWMNGGETAGTTGQALRMEAIEIKTDGRSVTAAEGLSYRVHVQAKGWMDWVKEGKTAGTTGQALRMEAIEIKMDNKMKERYNLFYRVHVQDKGWMDWVGEGETAGTTGQALRMEAIEIKLIQK